MKKQMAATYGVIGLGRFGTALAMTLAKAGKEVIVIDKIESKVREMRQYTDYAFIVDELTESALRETGIQNCDVVIVCIGEKVDVSILTTMSILGMGVPRVISKAISQEQGAVLRRLGMPGLAQRLTMHLVRKLAHFCEYLLEGFLLMLCMRVYSRRPLRHITVPMLAGVLTALTDETIQLFSEGRSSQVTDVWLDSAGVLAGILAALLLMGLWRLLFHHRKKE